MTLCPAQLFDIPQIMAIEHAAFIPQIQEKQSVFERRLQTFPEGFLVLSDADGAAAGLQEKAVIAGYFCSERWGSVPGTDDYFTLGHDATEVHKKDGPILYVSSFALLPRYRGSGLGFPFFKGSLEAVCSAVPDITTVALVVNREWTRAAAIYQKLGFTEERCLNSFFPSLSASGSADGILMTAPATLFQQEIPR
jgi:[ribosomal protein S18]-alanine N-acetyltransferase